MDDARALPDLLRLGGRWTLVGGKGGVGKTTTAAALAVSLAEGGRGVLVLSVDPAHSLGDALGAPLGPEPAPVPGVPGLRAMEVDPALEQRRFLDSRRGALLALLDRGTYLDADDAAGLTDLALPGMDELAALFRLLDLTRSGEDYLVVDTAPTGHTLRLLDLPALARAWLGALEAMEEKHRAVAVALAGGYAVDDAARMLNDLDADLTRLSALLRDPERTRVALVTTRDPVVLAETRRYQDELERRGIALAGIVVNRSTGPAPPSADGGGMVFVPPLDPEPTGLEGLRRFASGARPRPGPDSAPGPGAAGRVRVGARFVPPTDRLLYLVGGKGGVGKSTSACALALSLAEAGRGPVLLLSTDPAGSLGEVLGQEVGREARRVAGTDGVFAQQLDAEAEWAAFRGRYREEAERLFAGLLSGGLSAGADQRVVERLIDLAPPGIDELVALLEVVDLTEDRPYDAVIVDSAPTGHFLRLLELPDTALEWVHALLRLLLKYRDVVGLGELGERTLRLARTLRELRARLTDARETWLLAVALPEALSVPETERLLARLRALEMEAGGVLVNRLLRAGNDFAAGDARQAERLVAAAGDVPCAGAPECGAGPVGVEALRGFGRGWRRITIE